MTQHPSSRSIAVTRNRNRGFSLSELLTIMAIISILAGLGVSTVKTGAASALRQSGNVIADIAQLARQNALTHNAPTALLIVRNTPDPAVKDKAITLVEMGADQKWRQIDRWTVLPGAIIVDPTVSASSNLNPLPTPQGPESLHLRGKDVDPATDCDAYLFYPDGRLASPSATPIKLSIKATTGLQDAAYELVFNGTTGTYKVLRK